MVIAIVALNELTQSIGSVLAKSLCGMIGISWDELSSEQQNSTINSIDNCLALVVGLIAFGSYMAVWYTLEAVQFLNLGGAVVAMYFAIPIIFDFIAERFIDDDAKPYPIDDSDIGIGLQIIKLAIDSILKFRPEAFPILRWLFGQTA